MFSIDDFGTRYSSMEYMQRLPVHEVKIDKSFILSAINDLSSEKIVRSVIQLAHGLELSVTAEGVESEEMLKLFEGELSKLIKEILNPQIDIIEKQL